MLFRSICYATLNSQEARLTMVWTAPPLSWMRSLMVSLRIGTGSNTMPFINPSQRLRCHIQSREVTKLTKLRARTTMTIFSLVRQAYSRKNGVASVERVFSSVDGLVSWLRLDDLGRRSLSHRSRTHEQFTPPSIYSTSSLMPHTAKVPRNVGNSNSLLRPYPS